jgi:hypothetical protein
MDTRTDGRLTDTGEIVAYLGAHAVGLPWNYIAVPKLFVLLRQSGYDVLTASYAFTLVSTLVVMILFLYVRQYTSKLDQSLTGSEIVAYLGAHALSVLWSYLTARSIFTWLIQNGYRDQITIIQLGISICIVLVTLVIFLYARQYASRSQRRDRMSTNFARSAVSDATGGTPAKVSRQNKKDASQMQRAPGKKEAPRSPFDRGYD